MTRLDGRLGVIGFGLVSLALACAPRQAQSLRRASEALGQAVARHDPQRFRALVAPGAQRSLDLDPMLNDDDRRTWSKVFKKPVHVRPEAIIFLGAEQPVQVVWTDQGWRFAEDPTDHYAQDTPRHALRALVRATRAGRWDVLLRLAPRRYRLGLSEEDLRTAWTEGERGAELRASRDRLAAHLADPIVADADEAFVDLGPGHRARLEREGRRWVVVGF